MHGTRTITANTTGDHNCFQIPALTLTQQSQTFNSKPECTSYSVASLYYCSRCTPRTYYVFDYRRHERPPRRVLEVRRSPHTLDGRTLKLAKPGATRRAVYSDWQPGPPQSPKSHVGKIRLYTEPVITLILCRRDPFLCSDYVNSISC